MKYDFVIIGAGAAGITSALILAGKGHRVALVEKREQTAPLLRGFSRWGLRYDTGFHYSGGLAPGEPLDLFFRYLGLADRVASFPFDAGGFDLFRSTDDAFELRLPYGNGLAERLRAAFPDDTAAIAEYLELVREKCASLPYLNLATDFDRYSYLQQVQGPSLAQTLDRLTGNDRLKSVLAMHCLLYGVSPEQVPFSHHARIAGNYYRSARGIEGGGLALARAFDWRLERLGVDCYCSNAVTSLCLDSAGRLAGVRLADGVVLESTGCIATIDPRLLLDMAPTQLFRSAFAKRIATLEETVSAFMIFAACDAPVPFLAGRNVFLFPGGRPFGSLGTSPGPIYLTAAYPAAGGPPHGFMAIAPALYAATSRWEGSTRGDRPDAYRQLKDETIDRLHRQIERSCPELRGSTLHREGATPLTLRDFTSAPQGGLYGVKHMIGQYNPLPATRLAGLHLAGQAVIAPGLLGAVLSGFIACGSILGHDRLREELRSWS